MEEPKIPLQLPADLKKVETMSNKKLKLTFVSQEGVQDTVRSKIMGLHEAFGWLSFTGSTEMVKASEIANLPELQKHDGETKSPARRLRGVLSVLWKAKGEPKSFDEFYRSTMEQLIEHYKTKIDE